MRSQLLLTLLLSSCTVLFPAFIPETCEEGTPSVCAGDTLLSCVEGFEIEQACTPGVCDPTQLRCDVCGDGQQGAAEACDDGNTANGDGCSSVCEEEAVCGDGVVEGAEACDDGANNSDVLADACRSTCLSASCGDAIVDSSEGCDDGNIETGDGCDDACQIEFICGDGQQDPGEGCDDGVNNSDTTPDACRTDCTQASCGDTIVDSGEDCEPPGQGVCDANCQLPCNDASECDDADSCTTNDCVNTACVFSPLATIPDGDLCTQDLCDPANGAISHPPIVGINDNNACTDDACAGGVIANTPLATINDNNACTDDLCNTANGAVSHPPISGIDDNNECTADLCNSGSGAISNPPLDDGTSCNAGAFLCLSGTCTAPSCGDGFVDAANEQCDDDNNTSGDGCDANCLSEGACGAPSAANVANFGDTSNGTNELAGSCTGTGLPEQVFSFTPLGNNEVGTLFIALMSDTDQGVYVRTQCDAPATELGCIDDEFGGTTEFLTINNVQAGEPLSIIVDVFHDPTGEFGEGLPGTFVLFVEFTMCGNGIINTGEVCDDNNTNDGDGCRSDCRSNETCGNGVLDFQDGEECDDGNANNADGCTNACQVDIPSVCADVTPLAAVNIGDTRETQSAIDGFCFGPDGPESVFAFIPPTNGTLSLRLDSASEALIYVREACDDQFNDVACVDAADVFDSEFLDVPTEAGVPLFVFIDAHFGEASPFVLLSSFEECGNGVVNGPEACDDGDNISGDGCNATCTSDESCGNGFFDPGEACDDGNVNNNDGCESTCQFICGAATNPDGAILDPGTGHCYVGFDDFQPWNTAQGICAGFGGSLAVINSAAEATLFTPFEPFDVWIGLNDQAVEGTFVWVNGETVNFTDFSDGQPNNSGNQDCVVATVDGWFDDPCGDSLRYVCELP